MPDLNWNKSFWEKGSSWSDAGEEWSRAWGSSEAQWFGALYPRLHRVLPAARILEIGPGHGRWSKFLIPACSSYFGIDLSTSCIDVCQHRFVDASHAMFIANDGLSLDSVPEAYFDLIFSFDSLVHAELDVFQSYIPQLVKKLSRGGVAFLHHSNLLDYDNSGDSPVHGRAASVSRRLVADLIVENGGKVIIQESISWVSAGLLDCLTTFGRADDNPHDASINLSNPSFMDEAALISEFQYPYCRLR